MTIQVECYAGYIAEQEPRAFTIGDRRIDVTAVLDRWAGPDHRYFKIAASDGDLYILRHDQPTGTWTLGAYRRA